MLRMFLLHGERPQLVATFFKNGLHEESKLFKLRPQNGSGVRNGMTSIRARLGMGLYALSLAGFVDLLRTGGMVGRERFEPRRATPGRRSPLKSPERVPDRHRTDLLQVHTQKATGPALSTSATCPGCIRTFCCRDLGRTDLLF